METPIVGKVLVTALVENMADVNLAEEGIVPSDQIRRIEVHDALVDTGATGLGMPKRLIQQLGLRPLRMRRVRTSAGPTTVQVYGAVRLTIQERDCLSDVAELPEDCPMVIGQVPLELLDFVVDPIGQRLIGNPAHGGEHIIELY